MRAVSLREHSCLVGLPPTVSGLLANHLLQAWDLPFLQTVLVGNGI